MAERFGEIFAAHGDDGFGQPQVDVIREGKCVARTFVESVEKS
ncbi:MAG: hypothetical protein ACR2JB_26570 [Bryobacteraceae bacterium]